MANPIRPTGWNWTEVGQLSSFLKTSIPGMGNDLLNSGACWSHGMGLVHAIGETVLEVSVMVALVTEPIIKGLGNLFGSPFHSQCQAGRGLGFLIITIPMVMVFEAVYLPYIAIAQAIKLVVYPLWALADPKGLNDFVQTDPFPKQLFDKMLS